MVLALRQTKMSVDERIQSPTPTYLLTFNQGCKNTQEQFLQKTIEKEIHPYTQGEETRCSVCKNQLEKHQKLKCSKFGLVL